MTEEANKGENTRYTKYFSKDFSVACSGEISSHQWL